MTAKSAKLNSIRELALENLRREDMSPTPGAIGQALVSAILETRADECDGPTLEQVKSLLADVARESRAEHAVACLMVP